MEIERQRKEEGGGWRGEGEGRREEGYGRRGERKRKEERGNEGERREEGEVGGEEGAGGQECERSRKSEARAPFLKEASGGSGGHEQIVKNLTSQAGAQVGRADPDGRVRRAGHSSGILE